MLYQGRGPAQGAAKSLRRSAGIVGDQTVRAGQILRGLNLPADLVTTSAEWGAAKPDSAFFAHVIEVAPGEPREIVDVGDHRGNDLEPAKAARLRAAYIRQGPWGYLWVEDPKVLRLADWRIGVVVVTTTTIFCTGCHNHDKRRGRVGYRPDSRSGA